MKSLMAWGLCLLVLSAAAAGCKRGGVGEDLTEVTGRVTVDGEPVPGLQVLFEPRDQTKPSSVAYTNADGTYRVTTTRGEPGAVLGTHTVRVTSEESDEGPARNIPQKYNTRSELTHEVTSTPETYNIEITSN